MSNRFALLAAACRSRTRPLRHLALACALLWLVAPSTRAGTGLDFAPCALSGSDAASVRYAECATFVRPVDPAAPDGVTLELAVARVRAGSRQPREDAITLINGGPGAASIDLLVDLWDTVQVLANERDVIVIDQRGTGRSAPLRCRDDAAAQMEAGPEEIIRRTRACLGGLDYDPRQFTTSVAVTDLEALRETLGYRQWNVYGISYGTRVAQHYARRYPAQVRSLVIDGIVPVGTRLGANVVLNSQAALERLRAACAGDDVCDTRHGDFISTLTALRGMPPRDAPLPHPVTGEATSIRLAYPHLAAAVRLSLYAPETAAIVPYLINATRQGNLIPIAAQAMLTLERVDASIANGMHNAVVCTEDVPFEVDDTERQLLEDSYLGAEMMDTLHAICSVWPAGVLDADLHVPRIFEMPALLLSGAEDPITPPAYGEAMLPFFPHGRHLVAAGMGHGVLARGCVPLLVNEFVDTLDASAIDGTCLNNMPSMPVFLDNLGPAP
ncbi:MAG: alpha/beta fold hydrolase [Pseudomonadales bacterium]|nr:alpha/beta fold hydrolase [Pseudomonadales bacterium]